MAGKRKVAAGKKRPSSNPAGRTPTYSPKFHPELARAWATAGRTDEEIAELLGKTPRTLYNWRNKYPEFKAALEAGKVEPDDRMEAALFQRGLGYSHPEDKIFCHDGKVTIVPTTKHYPPDTGAAFIWLKNRRPDRWSDKQTLEVTGPPPSPEEILKQYAELEQTLAELERKGK